ncbi:hypothetical protein VP01_4g12 [Puccinia sorghi]|uniref:Tet-like 2OG-Fe(II) oxygenase domain-containing protein n=1 Tax=Puccinia sorghi TaxID=27349 RepID=A0A0L6ULQ5_9BASI|nr:hypothetical protein VP01_4g12 [Puccinia sorghi]
MINLRKTSLLFSTNISLLNLPIKIKISQMGHIILRRFIFLDGERDREASPKLAGWIKQKRLQRIQRNISSSQPMFLNKKTSLGLEPNFKENGFTCHLSFTISKFSNLPQKDTDASPFTFNLEVKGGNSFFPDDSCGINFSGFNGIVECAWKEYPHLNLPSNNPSNSLHTFMGLSFPLPKKAQAALEQIKHKFYEIHPNKIKCGIRDINKIIQYSAFFNKK